MLRFRPECTYFKARPFVALSGSKAKINRLYAGRIQATGRWLLYPTGKGLSTTLSYTELNLVGAEMMIISADKLKFESDEGIRGKVKG